MHKMSPGIDLRVSHQTVTHYTSRVEVAYHCAYLHPRDDGRQRVDDFALTIDPPPSQSANALDSFGNVRTEFALYVPHETLTVRAESRVWLESSTAQIDPSTAVAWDAVALGMRYTSGGKFLPASEFVYGSPYVPLIPELRDYAEASFQPRRSYLQAAIELMERIHGDFTYESGVTDVSTPLVEVFRQKRGVCQDFAHLMLGMLRALGLPSRYVSGYLLTQPSPGRSRLLGSDASHAWVSIWCPVLGWVDLDPTNAVLPSASHVTVAVGRDYGDVVPLRGVVRGGADQTLEVAVAVIPFVDLAA
jgi:transglutaminase-like putative cysteine protease